MPAFGDIGAHDDEGFAIRRLGTRNGCHARGRSVSGQPAAGVVSGGPCGLASIVDAEFVVEFHRLAPESAHSVAAGGDGAGGDVIDTMLGGFGIAQQIIAAIPPGGIFSGRKRSLADEIAHAMML